MAYVRQTGFWNMLSYSQGRKFLRTTLHTDLRPPHTLMTAHINIHRERRGTPNAYSEFRYK